jgi:hypothetical protein
MIANTSFSAMPLDFWAQVRLISQDMGYSVRGEDRVVAFSVEEIDLHFAKTDTSLHHFLGIGRGETLAAYFQYRADVLNNSIQHLLMDKDEAEALFLKLYQSYNPKCPLPMNKQKAEKKNYAFFTGIINILIEQSVGSRPVVYDPRSLTVIMDGNTPIRTFSRRMDGCFPSTKNPQAVWEIKEYYYTTSFGSRVAGGIYETLLDGMEIQEAVMAGCQPIKHYLFVDAKSTWWKDGKSYLCRMIDMLHMGYVTEIFFGKEVVERLPQVIQGW